jgi:hypothetical protein
VTKHEHWSSLAPLPLEVVLSAGQKAKDEPQKKGKLNTTLYKLKILFSDRYAAGANMKPSYVIKAPARRIDPQKVEKVKKKENSFYTYPSVLFFCVLYLVLLYLWFFSQINCAIIILACYLWDEQRRMEERERIS